MTGEEFEKFLVRLFCAKNYHVTHVGKAGDFGCDLLIRKYCKTTAVQAKRYAGKVGVKAVQEIYSAKAFYNADDAMVITNSFYTPAAKKLAKKLKVKLVDRNELYDIKTKI